MSTIRLRRTKESTAIEVASAVMLMASWIMLAVKHNDLEDLSDELTFASIMTIVAIGLLAGAYFPANRWINSFEATTSRQLIFAGRLMRIIAIESAVLFLLHQIGLFLSTADFIPDFVRNNSLLFILTTTVVWGKKKMEKMKKEDRKGKTGMDETESKK